MKVINTIIGQRNSSGNIIPLNFTLTEQELANFNSETPILLPKNNTLQRVGFDYETLLPIVKNNSNLIKINLFYEGYDEDFGSGIAIVRIFEDRINLTVPSIYDVTVGLNFEFISDGSALITLLT